MYDAPHLECVVLRIGVQTLVMTHDPHITRRLLAKSVFLHLIFLKYDLKQQKRHSGSLEIFQFRRL